MDELKKYEFYRNERTTIYCADNRTVLPLLEPASIDMAITSPPYDDLRTYEGFSWDYQEVANQLFRISRPGAVVVWVVGDQTVNGSETGNSFRQALYFQSIGFNIHDTMIYEKPGVSFPETNRYYPGFEYMFVFSNGQPQTASLIADRKNIWAGTKVHGTRRQPDGRLTRPSQMGEPVPEQGVRMNIWRIAHNKASERSGHPATFPLALAHDHLRSWARPGDTVLDPFMGSGTSLVAAQKLGMKAIGIEIEEKYAEIAVERLKQRSFDWDAA